MKTLLLILALTSFSITPVNAATKPTGEKPKTKITWHGQSAFQIVTPLGKVLLIDPWLKNPLNPAAKDGKNPVETIGKVDYILITHGHFDHVGDSVEIAKLTHSRLIANFELASQMATLLGYPKDQMGFDTLMNIGGEISTPDGEVTVAMTPAVHSSGLAYGEKGEVAYGGNPAGLIIKIKNGPTIYHTGDTAYFSDMKLIGEHYAPDVALINIGGHFGMEPDMAIQAAQAVHAKIVIPHHYKTFPILTQDPSAFAAGIKKHGMQAVVMNPGETIVFEEKKLIK